MGMNPVAGYGTFTVKVEPGRKDTVGVAPDETSIVLAKNSNPIAPPINVKNISTENRLTKGELEQYCTAFHHWDHVSEAINVAGLVKILKDSAEKIKNQDGTVLLTPFAVLEDLLKNTEHKNIAKDLYRLIQDIFDQVLTVFNLKFLSACSFENVQETYAVVIMGNLQISLEFFLGTNSSYQEKMAMEQLINITAMNFFSVMSGAKNKEEFSNKVDQYMKEKKQEVDSMIKSLEENSTRKSEKLEKLKAMATSFPQGKVPIDPDILYKKLVGKVEKNVNEFSK